MSRIYLLLLLLGLLGPFPLLAADKFNKTQPYKIQELFTFSDSGNKAPERLQNNYWIEMLIFADSSVQDRFSSVNDARNYIITLIKITNSLLRHQSLGLNITISIQDIIWVPKNTAKEILWGASLSKSIHRFCSWAMKKYYVRYNYDHALFLSRNINEAAGISPLNQMCRVLYSCTMAEDSGFFSAYPIAHELLHNLGVEHDGEGNSCDKTGRQGNIMAPLISSTSKNHHWSDCTKLNLKHNIASDDFSCIRDFPVYQDNLILKGSPGWFWSPDEQCQISTGFSTSRHCSGSSPDTCRQLMCTKTGNFSMCEPILNAFLLEGSFCNKDMECSSGTCTTSLGPLISPTGWSEFTEWSICSRTCGIGTQFRTRNCFYRDHLNKPLCPGPSQEYQLCFNENACPLFEDFRQAQCARFNNFKVRGVNHKWLPNMIATDVCRLGCRSMKADLKIDAWTMVRDGTKCTYSNEDARCVQGKCIVFDCEGRVEGHARRDRCGVCNGDNRTCTEVSNSFTHKLYSAQYRILYVIPRLARDIRITKESHFFTIRIISLVNMQIGIDGEKIAKGSKKSLVYQGAEFEFSREIEEEVGKDFVFTNGPLLDDIAVEAVRIKEPYTDPWPQRGHTGSPITLRVSYLLPLQ